MITPGEVRNIRELKRGLQAEVCLGASVELGTASTVVVLDSPKVRAALAALKDAIRQETRSLVGDILKDQKRWDEEMAG